MDIRKPPVKFRNLNYMKDPEDIRDYSFKTSLPYMRLTDALLRAPVSVDHSADMTPVKDQKRLGSCVGFAVTALKEWQEQKEHLEEVAAGKRDHRDDKYYDLSEAWVYWMSKKIDPWPNSEGTSIRFAMKVLSKIGVPCEKAWPYDDQVYGNPKSWSHLVARWSLIDSYWRVSGLQELKAALLDGPVVIGIGCYAEIFSPGKNGFVSDPANPNYCYGGHAVCAVGYNDKKKTIKFKNSWGTGWGARGYGLISYKYINNYMWDAWTCKDMIVTKDMLKESRSLFGV
jgi:C1A family cysteine protease